jgi:NADH dehydrogenase
MATQWQNALVTVFGASGFLGRHAVRTLARNGWRILGACRRPDLAGHLQPMGDVGQIHAVQANVRFEGSLRRPLNNARVVVNLAGLSVGAGGQTLEGVNVDGARAVASAARQAGATRLVHISAIPARHPRARGFARTKAEGEQAVLEEFPDAVILRPCIVFGPEDRLFNRLAAMARVLPILPLVGAGRSQLQPVYVDDVALAIAAAAAGRAKPGGTYELGGPHIVSLREMFDLTLRWTGRRRWYMPIPMPLATLLALMGLPLPAALRPLTSNEVFCLQHSNLVDQLAVDEGRTLAGLGIESPNAMATIVPNYLQRFHRRGQFARYRRLRRR